MLRNALRTVLERFPALMQFLRNSRDMRDRQAPAKKTIWGFTLAGHDAMAAGTYEQDETASVRKLLLEVDIMVNVGANVGYYCCHALSMGKPVIAVEPIARNLHYLMTNIRNNGWSQQAEVFPVALGEAPDILQMWGGGTGASLVKGWASIPESYVADVPILTLDRVTGDAIKGKRALILVDVEGAELMMLHGAIQTLNNDIKPIWVMEITNMANQPSGAMVDSNFKEIFEIFFEHGYCAVTADSRGQEITQRYVDEVMAGTEKLDAHNFIFR